MDQHAGGLIHRQQVVIFVQDCQLAVLRGIFRLLFIQRHGDHITGGNGVVRPLGLAVDPEGIPPLQLVHQRGGHFQFTPEKGRKLPLPGGCEFQFHDPPPLEIASSGRTENPSPTYYQQKDPAGCPTGSNFV